MITLETDCEYTVSVANLVETLASLKSFEMSIWVQSNELPFTFTDTNNLHFLQESIRIETRKASNRVEIGYVLYDTITHIEILGVRK